MRSIHRAAWVLASFAVLASCRGDPACTGAPSAGPDCADLQFQGRSYDEWRTIRPPKILQEVGDATYPSCNQVASCSPDGTGVGSFGATDVWQLGGVDPRRAVIGLREGTQTYVVFLAVGADPSELAGRFDEGRLG